MIDYVELPRECKMNCAHHRIQSFFQHLKRGSCLAVPFSSQKIQDSVTFGEEFSKVGKKKERGMSVRSAPQLLTPNHSIQPPTVRPAGFICDRWQALMAKIAPYHRIYLHKTSKKKEFIYTRKPKKERAKDASGVPSRRVKQTNGGRHSRLTYREARSISESAMPVRVRRQPPCS